MKPLPKGLILGHRGSPHEATENTLPSLAAALASGADGAEFDVRKSRDGVPVVIHDSTLDRTVGVKGRIRELHWAGIERRTGARVPSLEQVLAWAHASAAWINVEIKSPGVEEPILEQLARMGLRDRVLISSFSAASVARIGELDAGMRRYLLSEKWNAGTLRAIESIRAGGVCLGLDAASDLVLDELDDLQMPVVVWTVNDPANIRRLLKRSVAAIITDRPALAAAIRDELRKNS